MNEFDYQQLDDIIHSRIRLAIMSVLISIDEAEFTFLRDKVNATDGNLSTHLKKLEDAGYVAVNKSFINRKPASRYLLTLKGRKAFEIYVEKLEKMIKK
ncbi:MAG: transcriptional regulator [Ignavibacteriaceae bacterium]